MRYRFYKTHDVEEFWAVRMKRDGQPKMVPGRLNFAYGILPTNDPEGAYTVGDIDLDWLSRNTSRCAKETALKGFGGYAYLITERGLQFRHSVSSGVYAIIAMRDGEPIPFGVHKDKIPVIRGVDHGFAKYTLYGGSVCVETLHLDKVVSANVARKHDPVFVKTILEKYAAFTA